MSLIKAPAAASALVCVGLAAAVCGSAFAADAPVPEARIPFADHHGIYNWQVVDDRTVLIQSQNHQWYKATLLSHCIELPFAERIAFKTNADGSFDKFSGIETRGQYCPLTSLVQTAAPAKKNASKAAASAAGNPT
jgi:hypothetical protein